MQFKAGISIYVLLLLGMAIGLYLFGFTSMGFQSFADFERDDGSIDIMAVFSSIARGMVAALTDLAFIGPILVFSVLSSVLRSSNYQMGTLLMFVIPVAIAMFFVNFLFFPVIPVIRAEAHATPEMDTITLLLSIVLNTLLFLAILEFSSGRRV